MAEGPTNKHMEMIYATGSYYYIFKTDNGAKKLYFLGSGFNENIKMNSKIREALICED